MEILIVSPGPRGGESLLLWPVQEGGSGLPRNGV